MNDEFAIKITLNEGEDTLKGNNFMQYVVDSTSLNNTNNNNNNSNSNNDTESNCDVMSKFHSG